MRKAARLVLAAAALWLVLGAQGREARAQPAVDASVIGGVDKDLTAVGRLLAGGIWQLGKFAPSVHLGFDGFLRIDSSAGVAARSFSLINVGARYSFLDDNFVGPFVSGGGGFGVFTGKPHERKVSGEPDVCASATIPEEQPQDECFYRIDKNANLRFGLGYGFATGEKTTVAARIDAHYWIFSLNDFEDQPAGAPVPNMVDRPQATWSITVGLQFIRWR